MTLRVRLRPGGRAGTLACGNADAAAWRDPDARLHAGGDAWRGARAASRRSAAHRRADHARQHLSSPPPPGRGHVAALGGLHRFMHWDKPMLTDSGGFQVFSLEGLREITEEGVTFRSHVDGTFGISRRRRRRRSSGRWAPTSRWQFDHVVPGQAPWALAEEGMERSLRWLDRCRGTATGTGGGKSGG